MGARRRQCLLTFGMRQPGAASLDSARDGSLDRAPASRRERRPNRPVAARPSRRDCQIGRRCRPVGRISRKPRRDARCQAANASRRREVLLLPRSGRQQGPDHPPPTHQSENLNCRTAAILPSCHSSISDRLQPVMRTSADRCCRQTPRQRLFPCPRARRARRRSRTRRRPRR